MFKKGRKYVCVDSKSNAYKKGQIYECLLSPKGDLVLQGGDGLMDNVKTLVSKFKEVKDE